jgi:N,N'-diacetyllegionaminate synthase
MYLFNRDLKTDFAVIAEVGVNHEGSVEKASELLRLAAHSGADAVKFQSYTASRFVSTADPARFERINRFALDEAAHRRLAKEAEDVGITFFSAAISEDWVPLLSELCPVIKIASGDLTFEPVISAAVATGKPLIISTGCCDVDEIDKTVGLVRELVGKDNLADRLALMHCVSAYPTPPNEANVRSMEFLAERYGLITGYSNHVIGLEASLAAVALGASLIEVHFTDNKMDRDFHDHHLSFEPDELKAFVASARRLRECLGAKSKAPQPSELPVQQLIRKGLIASEHLLQGTVLKSENIHFARPSTEFRADEINDVVGKKLTRSLAKGETIARDDISD